MPYIKFQYRDHVTQAADGKVVTAKLGTAPTDTFSTYGTAATPSRPMKIDVTQDSTWIDCADGDDIEGFVYAVDEKDTLYDQRKLGSIQTEWFRMAYISGAYANGDYVVADGAGGVKSVGAAAPASPYAWRIWADLGVSPHDTAKNWVTLKRV